MKKSEISPDELEAFRQKLVGGNEQDNATTDKPPSNPREEVSSEHERFFREIREWHTGKMFIRK